MNLLDQTLCLLDGVSPEAEIRLRRSGVLTCRQLAEEAERHFSSAHAGRVKASWQALCKANELGLAGWFVAHLPAGHRVRALREFRRDAVFFDIETDGMGRDAHVTCITTWRDGNTKNFVRDKNLEGFLEEWSAAKILVGFNSKRFDTPMVCREFGLTGSPPQIDLMDEAAHYGLRGGLKAIERVVGFTRADVNCKNGEDAVECWRRYRCTGSQTELDAMLAYNRDDVLSLLHLSRRLLKFSLENTFIVL
ncbi:MAG: ribonuclease H-like domain-containing protein [Kiritimatiellae bacterium]|nr:ribonuclease H-like domain-containing protein [Kiritimatiellia bacterium]